MPNSFNGPLSQHVLLVLSCGFVACDRLTPPSAADSRRDSAAEAPSNLTVFDAKQSFKEVTGELGIPNPNLPYPDGTFMAPEITPGSVAVFDFDNDGLLDILEVRHPAPSPWEAQRETSEPNRLYRQGTDGRFVLVPNAGGAAGKGFHHGVAVGDVNGDGFADVYLCNLSGPDNFFLNAGNGTFVDAMEGAGFLSSPNKLLVSEENWSSTAAFFDCDRDGDLDLWVVHFATFDPSRKCKATSTTDELDYCGPHTFPGQLATLWRNDGRGVFTDATAESGINMPGRGWGVIAADLTGDGLADVFQANDEEANQFWVNQGDGTFADEALLRGCALNAFGSVEANMGVAVGDARNTGIGLDLYVTHISGETNTLWATQGDGLFADSTGIAGMGMIDRPFTGWGCGFFDYDNDGLLDLAVANGRVARGPVRPEADVGPFWNRFAEPNLLFRGEPGGRMVDVSSTSGDFTKKLEVHRALAFADLRNRGAVDLITMNLDNTLRVFRNQAVPPGHHWLQVLPMVGKREALGARVTLAAGGRTRAALCLRAYSYLASNDPRVHFGLGTSMSVDSLEIGWPSGKPERERFEVREIDRVLTVQQGAGQSL